MKHQSRNIYFAGFDGSQLAATLDFPAGVSPKYYAIISHCFTCTKQTLTTARLSRGLAQAGLGVLRFDFTGLGESGGEFADTHFSSMVSDIACAANWLATHYEPARVLIGHSMGGTASLAASQQADAALSQVQKIITLASPAYPAHVLHHFGETMGQLQRGEPASILVAGQRYPVKPSFIKDVESYDMQQLMRGCKKDIMAIQAGEDELIEPQAAEQILQYTKGQTCLQKIEGANHLFSDRDHAQLLLSAIIEWLDR
ncbi:hypothetical protein MNBD_GAMMA08-2774 [hydrothermal vent metagenome]|uniref:Serine aminopeptidase S33 domain-containing protein n=1 Tax=hydrothermal vent metagenome TaxID=652676 RepID=A0A3B0WQN0_9ZZZZ